MDGDLMFGVLVTVIFLALIFGAGFLLSRFKNRRFEKAWQPLVPLVGGTVRGDGGGSATSWLSGAYKGKTVHASLSPNAGDSGRTGSSTTGFAYNAFEVRMRDVPGAQDWSVTHRDEWRIQTGDPALQERLRTAGVLELVASLGQPSHSVVVAGLPVLAYTARDRQLHFREDAGPVWLPGPDRFQQELETLLRLADVNARVNPA